MGEMKLSFLSVNDRVKGGNFEIIIFSFEFSLEDFPHHTHVDGVNY